MAIVINVLHLKTTYAGKGRISKTINHIVNYVITFGSFQRPINLLVKRVTKASI